MTENPYIAPKGNAMMRTENSGPGDLARGVGQRQRASELRHARVAIYVSSIFAVGLATVGVRCSIYAAVWDPEAGQYWFDALLAGMASFGLTVCSALVTIRFFGDLPVIDRCVGIGSICVFLVGLAIAILGR